MKCKYFRTRSMKKKIYYYCTLLKKETSLSCYQECEKKEYKQYKKLTAKTEYKYHPKKGKANRYYNDNSIMPKSYLYSNIKVKGYQKHHIFGNVANRPKSEKYGLFVWFSEEQHRYLTDHPLENLKLKQLAQKIFMEYYDKTEDEFREIFGKNYLKQKKT